MLDAFMCWILLGLLTARLTAARGRPRSHSDTTSITATVLGYPDKQAGKHHTHTTVKQAGHR